MILPAVCLLLAALYLPAANLLHIAPFAALCLLSLPALAGCLIWGSSLCSRMLQPWAFYAAAAITALLSLSHLLFFCGGIFPGSAAFDIFIPLSFALLLPIPAALLLLGMALRAPDHPIRPAFWVLLAFCVLCLPFCWLLPSWLEGNYALAFLFFCAAFCAAQSILIFSVPVRRRGQWPLLLFPLLALLLGAAVLLSLKTGHGAAFASASTAALLTFGALSADLQAQLLPEGSKFPTLLQHATLPVQIMDDEGSILLGADLAFPLSPAHRTALRTAPGRTALCLDADTELCACPIPGGLALSQRDLRDLHQLQHQLALQTQELSETQMLLAREEEIRAKLARLSRKNTFFSVQETRIQRKVSMVSVLLQCAAANITETGFRRSVISRIHLLLCYLQAQSVLLSESKETDLLSAPQFCGALETSAKAATAAGLRCRVYHVAQGMLQAETALDFYDFFESVLECAFCCRLREMEVWIRNEHKGLRMVLSIARAEETQLPDKISELLSAAASLQTQTVLQHGTLSIRAESCLGGEENA